MKSKRMSLKFKKGITIKDIAKKAGVSHTTVSRALANSPLITQKQKVRIQSIAKKMGYIPNLSARSLVRRRSFTIGLFFSSIGTHVTADFYYTATTILQKAIKDQYNMVVRSVDDYNGNFSTITPQFFDGLLLISQTKKDDAFIQHLINHSVPFVLINRLHQNNTIDCVYADERRAIYELVHYIASLGHRRISFVRGPKGRISTIERSRGFVDAAKSLMLSVNDYIFDGDYTFESGYAAGSRIARLHPLPTAVICSNDNMAIGLIKSLRDKNISVPETISVAGFDGSEIARYLTPSLCTIKRPVEKIVAAAADRLLQKLSGNVNVPYRICFPCERIDGGTVIALNKGETQ